MGVLGYSTTAGSNANALSGVGSIAENVMPIKQINDAIRQQLADVAQLYADTVTGITTTGTGSAYVAATASGHSSYSNQMALRLRFHTDCAGGATTINVNVLGTKALKVFDTAGVRDPIAGEIKANMACDCIYVTALNAMVVTGQGAPVVSDFARTVLDDADAATMRATLGAQASDATLTNLAALSVVAGDTIYATAPDTFTPLAKGTAGQIYRMNSGATAPEWANAGFTWATTVNTTSGTLADLSLAIPAGVSELVVSGRDVSLTAGDNVILRLGITSGFVATGYVGGATIAGSSGFTPTGGFGLALSAAARTGIFHMTLHKMPGGNIWTYSLSGHDTNGTNALVGGGYVDLGGALTQARVIATGGAFDSGAWNIGWR